VYNVLFVCTSNSARSIFGEVLLNQPSISQGRFHAYSAGSAPVGHVDPLAIEALEQNHLPTAGLHSKSWNEFAAPNAPHMDIIVTVCDQAASETCPVWPGHPATAHWSIPDPAATDGDDEHKARAFRDALADMRRRIDLLVMLPEEKVSQVALRQHLAEIAAKAEA
jgi:arsenate reductase